MNKDVIYIESSDDIANVVAKIENSKEKIVAVVPPKDAEIFRSIINMKLIAKAGEKAEKTIVLVTTDAAILKLAAVLRMLVTKDLQTAPAVPKVEELTEVKTTMEETVEDEEANNEEEKKSEEDGEEKFKKEEKTNAKKENNNAFVRWLKKYEKILIFSGITAVVLAVFLVWAFVIAPSATVTVEIHTAKSNFSENISFTTKLEEEKASEGKFFLEEKKDETTEEKKFTATGKKNIGEKASGKIIVSSYFQEKGSKYLKAGTEFKISDLVFISDEDVNLEWGGKPGDCENVNNVAAEAVPRSGCLLSQEISVTASASGAKYNIAASSTAWSESSRIVDVYSAAAMTGGTDKEVTVVQQSDIDKIKEQIVDDGKTSKEKLLAAINDSSMPIESSFKYEVTKVVSTPEVGKEVKEGEKATAKVTITAKMYILDKTKIEEFITNKAKLGEGYKIYSIDDPFIENFVESTAGFIGKLKTSYTAGAKITENEIVEKIRGRGLGDAQHDLKNIEGISSVKIDTPFPWINSIPNDTNKIFVNLTIK